MHRFILTLFFLSFFLKSFSQSSELPDDFDQKELKDSLFRQVLVLRYYYDYNQSPEWIDSVSLKRYDVQGRLIYQKDFIGGGDSIVNQTNYAFAGGYEHIKDQYFQGKHRSRILKSYAADGRIIAWGHLGSAAKGYQGSVDSFFYDANKKLLRESGGTTYFYDQKGRLERTEYRQDSTDPPSVYYYYYNQMDSVRMMKLVEASKDKKDSVFFYYSYDKKGRRIEEIRQPSHTYYKTFNFGCSTGDYYCNQYAYDSVGRIIYEGNFAHEVTGATLAYASEIFARYTYLPYGYLRQAYDLKGKPTWTTVFSNYETVTDGYRIKRESVNESTSIITYLSKKSSLPKRIDGISRNGIKETTIFIYEKQ